MTIFPAPVHRLVGLQWEKPKDHSQIAYDCIAAETPFGRILITWKGWKEPGNEGFSIDEFPGRIPDDYGWDLEQTKRIAEQEWEKRVALCLQPNVRDQPAGASAPSQA
jgi:hypothetical protein